MTDSSNASAPASSGFRHLLPDAEARKKQRRRRAINDKLSAFGISMAGLGVVGALALIFVYLFSEVAPLLRPASIEAQIGYSLPEGGPHAETVHLTLDRYQEIGMQVTRDGRVIFFDADAGGFHSAFQVPIPDGATVTSFGQGEKRDGLLAFGLDTGEIVVAKVEYELTYPEGTRVTVPKLTYPLGEAPIVVDDLGEALIHVAVQEGRRGTVAVAQTADGRLLVNAYRTQRNIFSGDVQVTASRAEMPAYPGEISRILVDGSQRNVFIADPTGYLAYYDISTINSPSMVQRVRAVREGGITAISFLAGTVSLIVGGSDGSLSQWFLIRDENNAYALSRIRDFVGHRSPVTAIDSEYTRKGFLSGAKDGTLGIHFATSSRTLLRERVLDGPISAIAISPINGRMLVTDTSGGVHPHLVENRHPQVSFRAMWQRVWYEGRGEPEYVWQASSASDEFEPKMSLVPLTVGTLKAAFFAMLIAMPVAVMGAIYSAYFMTPRMRGVVKPTIEIMEALPTVILGFLAGLWLAPFVEDNLPVVFTMLFGLPLGMLLAGYVWFRLPQHYKNYIPPGWEAATLVPVVLVIGWICVASSPYIQLWFFDGSMRQWFTDQGITYDQRNALVVGIAMGFAVIPTIFSIAEDAVFNVPRHLTQGSLALGATAWQTVMGVVLPTASPGIFSAVMIGFGRAVGETMIVVMATGNSPVVNFNIFEGMRTLSANVAVELPETAVGSTHFRVLFLAALVLLTMTFIVNTIAEIVRQRLRARYSNL
ncbi:ABC transporter permease subunit [Isoalcanivorax indicus]|uniref:ABC transporter permease subunit n=1 Tax=Isoalcanivorax indicus TaxID=2202653 RepID=UPI000DB94055|nr:ABC transporter permease subunit [Isoalcanivorax indicus]